MTSDTSERAEQTDDQGTTSGSERNPLWGFYRQQFGGATGNASLTTRGLTDD